MGGELKPGSGDKPTFMVVANKDSGTALQPGVPLQRVQIVKGWLTPDGKFRERVFEVTGDARGTATVDSDTCAMAGEGFGELCAVWTDESFQVGEQAYYYSRVLENPSCRWSQRICVERGVDCARPDTIGDGLEACCSPQHQRVIQERAWSSPIWYTPVAPDAASASG